MSAAIPTSEPAQIAAGDTAKWLRSLVDYSAADGWVLAYTLVSSAQRYTFAATASGADHLVTVAAATTTAWVAGTYQWRAQVAKAGEVFTVGQGSVVVAPNFASAVEARSDSAVALQNINDYLKNTANIAASEYEIAGRKLRRYSIPDLLKLRSQLQLEVLPETNAQRAAAGLAPAGRMYVRYGPGPA